ncbi:hypothetical protein yc1106_06007 [Curvularia clavata]|uniref:Uncharacterized protein n=1 Tax=Curvularia clavata TaxID=95742 RepID=A0A9Q8ZDI4_CURCL|nr:hypothetical protein yc1106_06007 [Curvularia clavata]
MIPTITISALLLTLPMTTASPLTKRDDDYPLPIAAMILLIILGAGMAVCIGYAIHKTFGFRPSGNGVKNVSAEQMEYMTEAYFPKALNPGPINTPYPSSDPDATPGPDSRHNMPVS